MPDILSHTLFGINVIEKLNNTNINKNIKYYKNLFNLGSQGPDFLFYYKFLKWKKETRIRELGTLLHNQKSHLFFKSGIRKIFETEKFSNDYFSLLFYLMGFICHYHLDKSIHPYVYYTAGVHNNKKPETFKYFKYHQLLEVVFDCILFEEKYNKPAHKEKIYTLIDNGERLPRIVNTFLKDTFLYSFSTELSSECLDKAYHDMRLAFKILYDPYNIKKRIFSAFFSILGYDSVPGRPFHPRLYDTSIDYMNLLHKVWNHPVDLLETYTYSFYDLYNMALEDTLNAINKLLELDDYNESVISSLFPNDITYNTNKPFKPGIVMKYTNCIFE